MSIPSGPQSKGRNPDNFRFRRQPDLGPHDPIDRIRTQLSRQRLIVYIATLHPRSEDALRKREHGCLPLNRNTDRPCGF